LLTCNVTNIVGTFFFFFFKYICIACCYCFLCCVLYERKDVSFLWLFSEFFLMGALVPFLKGLAVMLSAAVIVGMSSEAVGMTVGTSVSSERKGADDGPVTSTRLPPDFEVLVCMEAVGTFVGTLDPMPDFTGADDDPLPVPALPLDLEDPI
jgi:hypothetical protein